ncbi:unnamed protein product [Penicillium pancosmium]
MINGSFCDRDSTQLYTPDLSDQDSQYAPTPGYYNKTLHSHFEFSPTPDRYPQGSPVASICAPQETPRLLQVVYNRVKSQGEQPVQVGGQDKECDPDTKCLLAFGPEG